MNVSHKPKLLKLVALLLVLAAVTGASGYWLYSHGDRASAPAVATASTETDPTPETVTYVAEAGVSVLDQLRQVANVETKDSTYGTLVESINGLKNGTDDKYWLFYVDGQMADKGADAYIAKGGEKIEWKFFAE